jgi:hypothetical protein
VLVADRGGLADTTIAEMQSEASFVLGKAGISTKWVHCPFSTEPTEPASPCGGPLGGTRFLVRITRDRGPTQGSVWDTALGFARITPDGGSYAILMMDPIEELSRQHSMPVGRILGYAAAHEIGHMLMGSHSHSPRGLMRAKWTTNEWRDLAERRLLFSKQEVERMRAGMAARPQR